jgi:hypothetical protein
MQWPVAPNRHGIYLALRRLVFRVLGRALDLRDPNVLSTLNQLLLALPSVNWMVVLLLDYYPDLQQSSAPLTAGIAGAGLGKRGSYDITAHIWARFVPKSLVKKDHRL